MASRRDALVALPAYCAAPFARAQLRKQVKPRRIGELGTDVGPAHSDPAKPIKGEDLFWEKMREKGWILGENVLVERVYANGHIERLAGLAEELVRKRVDVVVADGEEAAVAAGRATRSIPILFSGAVWPVELGLIESFAKPGRNLTGVTDHSGADTVSKRLEFLRAIVPDAKRLSWLWGSPATVMETVGGGQFNPIPPLQSAANGLGFDTRFHVVRAPEDIAEVFPQVLSWRAQAITAGGWTVNMSRQTLAELALRNRIPVAGFGRSSVTSGALLSYGPPREEVASMQSTWLVYLDRILRGARPAELAVIQPSRYELVINMRTAKALALTIPPSVLQRADELFGQ